MILSYQVSGFKSRPSYEEILEQQDQEDPDEQIEITAMMIQPATNESSNTTEELKVRVQVRSTHSQYTAVLNTTEVPLFNRSLTTWMHI
jgi:hypothetical protein